MKDKFDIIVPLMFAAALLGHGCGLARPYKCGSDLEQNVYNMARRNIHPDDVRITPKGYIDQVLVAWAGKIIERKIEKAGDEVDTVLLVEHHHFDWMEDFRLGANIYVLSSRGEGRFRTTWPMSLRRGMEAVENLAAQGNMVIVYGTPLSVEYGIITLESYCVRFVLPDRFRMSEFPYGRNVGYQY